MIKIEKTAIKDINLIKPDRFVDDRGFFQQSYQYDEYYNAGIHNIFNQDNCSHSKKGVLRGLHYQLQNPQAKLVYVVVGSIFDVAVDMREYSPTFGKWIGQILSADNGYQLYIPRGFAHGFLSLEEGTVVNYKCDNKYVSEDEYGVKWDDPSINIKWPIEKNPIVSMKDNTFPLWNNAVYFSEEKV